MQSNSFTIHTFKKIFVTLIEDMYWNLFSSIVHILAAFFLFNNEYRLLSTSFLIRLALFNKTARKFFLFFFNDDVSMDGQRSSNAKPSSINVTLTDFLFGCGLLTIAQCNFAA